MRNPLAEVGAIGVTLVLGGIAVGLLAAAFTDGETRRREAPLRAMLGSEAYEALMRGEPTPQHYLGNDRLAPDFTLRDDAGRPWRLSDHRGHVVVLNFWTVTCQPCIEEMPSLIDLAELLRHRSDVELVSIDADRDWTTAHTVIPERSPLRVLLDPDRAVTRGRFGTRLFPETWVIDPSGVIRLRVDGPRDWSMPLALGIFETYR